MNIARILQNTYTFRLMGYTNMCIFDTYFQAQCIMGIVDYIKKNPKASETELAKEVMKHVEIFQAQVAAS